MPGLQPHHPHVGLILPLATSSATIGLSLFQYPVFWSFLADDSKIAGRPLSRFWEPFLKSGGALVTATALTSVISGLLSMRWLQTHGHLETSAVAQWYGYGALAAIGHFAFVPLVATPIKRMVEGANTSGEGTDVERVNREEMKSWMTWHTVRTVTVDIAALWCFAEGLALSLWVI